MRTFRTTTSVIAMIILLVIATNRSISAEADPARERAMEQSFQPLFVLTGAKSEVKEASYHRITSAAQLEDVWRSHIGRAYGSGDHPIPAVDFNRCLIIAIFQGDGFNSHGLRVISSMEGDEMILVRFDDISYQTLGDGNQVSPYAFFVLPTSQKTIVLEEDVRALLNAPPIWKEVARFSANGN